MSVPVLPQPLSDALARIMDAPVSLLAVGIPSCPSCELLEVSLGAVAASRPQLAVAFAEMSAPDEWSQRGTLLWPRGVRPSRSSVPLLALLEDGTAVATRFGGGPASAIDAWLADRLGPAPHPLPAGLTDDEESCLVDVSGLRARHLAARHRHA